MPGGTITLKPSYGIPLTAIVASAPARSGGVGGWQASERARRGPGKWFKAVPDDTYSWTLILDSDATYGKSNVEQRIRNLRDMGRPHDGEAEPPVIDLTGDIWEPDSYISWVMDGMSLGERLYAGDGTLIRQHVTVELSRANLISEIEAVAIEGGRKGGKKRQRTIKTKEGDNLRRVALRELGKASRWQDIRKWNKKKLAKVNPDARLKTGTRLVIK